MTLPPKYIRFDQGGPRKPITLPKMPWDVPADSKEPSSAPTHDRHGT